MVPSALRYPENSMEFAPTYPDDIPEHWQRFFDLREELLLGYGYNTARAYWADLQDWFEWAVARHKDVLALTELEEKQYYALLRRRRYSESTVRRRETAMRLLRRSSHPITHPQQHERSTTRASRWGNTNAPPGDAKFVRTNSMDDRPSKLTIDGTTTDSVMPK